jgi:hypothetical protein
LLRASRERPCGCCAADCSRVVLRIDKACHMSSVRRNNPWPIFFAFSILELVLLGSAAQAYWPRGKSVVPIPPSMIDLSFATQ